jgi:hypothetical protein
MNWSKNDIKKMAKNIESIMAVDSIRLANIAKSKSRYMPTSEKSTPQIAKNRVADTGANRDFANDKIDYHKFNHPIVDWSYGQFMHGHRKLADGTMRDGDNWTKGFPNEWILGSATRHMEDWKLMEKGFIVKERGKIITLVETLNAIKFNVNCRILKELEHLEEVERNEEQNG